MGIIDLKYSVYILMKLVIHPFFRTSLFNLVFHHWSTQTGLWDGDSLLLDNLCQGQPRGKASQTILIQITDINEPPTFSGSFAQRDQGTQLLFGKRRIQWIQTCRLCVLYPMCSHCVMAIQVIRRIMITEVMIKACHYWALTMYIAGTVLRASDGFVYKMEGGAVCTHIV